MEKLKANIAIQSAINVLKEFTSSKPSLVHSFTLPFFSAKSQKEKDQISDKNKILSAVKTLQRYQFLIAKFSQGTPEEQELAASAVDMITHYNASITNKKLNPIFPEKELSAFLHRIEIPPPIAICDNHKKISHAFLNNRSTNSNPLPEEIDIMRLKAASMLKSQKIHFTSISETLALVHKAPINVLMEKQSSVATVTLMIRPLPGTTLHIVGSFQRTMQKSIPIANSFKIIVESIQNGFPRASQYTGWSLSDALIPLFPHHLEKLSILQSIFKRKMEAALELLPNGKLTSRAANLHGVRHRLFMNHVHLHIEAHHRLAKAIFMSAPSDSKNEEMSHAIEIFFSQVAQDEKPFEYISETYQLISDKFITAPFSKLKEEWLEHKVPSLYDSDETVVFSEVTRILHSEFEAQMHFLNEHLQSTSTLKEKKTIGFVIAIGFLLGKASLNIILQHLSETFGFSPPLLNVFEQKVQAAAFKQLTQFLDELESEEELPEKHLLHQLESDSALFLSTGQPSKITQILESYFSEQHMNFE